MPKKQTKTAKAAKAAKSAKPAKAKLPKEIAGVKIGRDLRSAIEPVLRFASHPLVSDTLAAALIAGADALGGKKGKAGAKGAAASADKDGGPVGLMLAVAAGEIASRIVSAYEGKASERRAASDRRAGEDRRTAATPRKKQAERRAGTADRRAKVDRRGA